MFPYKNITGSNENVCNFEYSLIRFSSNKLKYKLLCNSVTTQHEKNLTLTDTISWNNDSISIYNDVILLAKDIIN